MNMFDADRLFFLIALINTGISLSNSAKNTEQQEKQIDLENTLNKIYDKLLEIEKELKHDARN